VISSGNHEEIEINQKTDVNLKNNIVADDIKGAEGIMQNYN